MHVTVRRDDLQREISYYFQLTLNIINDQQR